MKRLFETELQFSVKLVTRCLGCNGELQTTFYEPDMLKVKPCSNCCCNRPVNDEESIQSKIPTQDNVYSRAECLFNYCPSPEICADGCMHRAKQEAQL